MKTIKIIEPLAGEIIDRFLVIAQNQADAETDIQFEFNGIKCTVSRTSAIPLMLRDYHAAIALDWKEIGPNPDEKYDYEKQSAVNKWLEEKRRRWTGRGNSYISSCLTEIEKLFEQ